MITYAIGVAWIALHLGAYVGLVRHRHIGAQESGMARFHACSLAALAAALAALSWVAPAHASTTAAVGALALHGIYSLSFLELWLLADGSYSLRILAPIAARGQCSEIDLQQKLAKLGSEKQEARTTFLVARGLVRRRGDRFCLTATGRVLAALLAALAWLPDYRERG